MTTENRPRIRRRSLVLAALSCAALILSHSLLGAEPPATRPAPRRILFLGNSITRHGPKPDIGWTGNWGMAASAAEKDYAHVLVDALAARTGTRPEFKVENISDFERRPDTFDYKARLGKLLEFKPDLVVIAIGENVPGLRNDEAKAAFRQNFQKLLATIKEKNAPAILVRSCFWPDPAKDSIMKQVSADSGATFVDISAIGKDPSNKAKSERKIDHEGVAAHPGDKGMKAIADALLAAILDQGSVKKN